MKKELFALGIVLALIGAAIMFEGSLFDERTTGIATVIGIVGICLIATSSARKDKKS
jgi:predicted membrane protein